MSYYRQNFKTWQMHVFAKNVAEMSIRGQKQRLALNAPNAARTTKQL